MDVLDGGRRWSGSRLECRGEVKRCSALKTLSIFHFRLVSSLKYGAKTGICCASTEQKRPLTHIDRRVDPNHSSL